jgi:hypothetical protein
MTTYTATYAELTDAKKAYTLKNAKVSYDTTQITDGNQVEGIPGYVAQDVPEVTVVIDNVTVEKTNYVAKWSYNDADNTVTVTVDWADAIKGTDEYKAEDESLKVTAKNDSFKVKAKDLIPYSTTDNTTVIKTVAKKGTKTIDPWYEDYSYDPKTPITVKTTVSELIKGATVKYAVTNTDPTEDAVTEKEEQKAIEALDYNLDKVELQAVGDYYVFAQISADGYTTRTIPVAVISIVKKHISVYVDDATIKEGETPDLKVKAYDYYTDEAVEVDPSEFTITTAGGQEISSLKPGVYRLTVSAKNYHVHTAHVDYVATLTVLTKEGKTPEQDVADTAKAADKALEKANAVSTSKYTTESVNKVKEAQKALETALATGSNDDVKAATAALNDAIDNLVAKKNNPMKVKTKVVKANSKKKVSNKVGLVVKKAKGTKSFKKVSGDKRITVNKKTGKFTVKKGLKKGKTYKVKVQVKAAGNDTYKAKTVTKTVKVKVVK